MDKFTCRYYIRLIQIGFKQAITLKKVFVIRVLFMILNNLMMLYAWRLMFLKFPKINTWTFQDFMFMTGFVVLVFSVWPIFLRGIGIHLMRLIENGELDSYLVQPRNVLFSVGCSVCDPFGIGDFITGCLLIGFSGLVSLGDIPLIMCLFLTGATVFLSVNILISSLPFFLKGSSDIGERLFYMFFNIAGYPGSIYGGVTKIMFCTIFPIGLISILPVELIRFFSPALLTYLILFSLVLLVGSIFVFFKGLKHYESGNRYNIHY